jgi:hypothetical protein
MNVVRQLIEAESSRYAFQAIHRPKRRWGGLFPDRGYRYDEQTGPWLRFFSCEPKLEMQGHFALEVDQAWPHQRVVFGCVLRVGGESYFHEGFKARALPKYEKGLIMIMHRLIQKIEAAAARTPSELDRTQARAWLASEVERFMNMGRSLVIT